MSDADPLLRRPARLAQLELLDADGHVLHAYDVTAWPLRIGRALDNDIVLHDPHAAARHAQLDVDDSGRLILTVGASRNGVRLLAGRRAQRLAANAAVPLPPLARWTIGNTTLRVRRLDDALADEAPVGPLPSAAARWQLAALAAALWLWFAGDLWLENEPDSTWDDYAPALLALPLVLAAWAGAWGLASRLFSRRFAFVPHLRLVCAYSLAAVATDAVLGWLAFAFDWPLLSAVRSPLAVLIGAALIAHHLRQVAPAAARVTAGVVAALVVAGLAVTTALRVQNEDRWFDELYLTTLPPPQWRLVDARPPAALVNELRALQAPLAARARELARKDTGDTDADDGE